MICSRTSLAHSTPRDPEAPRYGRARGAVARLTLTAVARGRRLADISSIARAEACGTHCAHGGRDDNECSDIPIALRTA